MDDSFSDLLQVFHDGTVNGSVSFHDTNTHYQFAMAGNGDVAIRQRDVTKLGGTCEGCANPELLAAEIAPLSAEDSTEGEVLAAPAGATPFDSVIGYSLTVRREPTQLKIQMEAPQTLKVASSVRWIIGVLRPAT